MVWHRLRHNWRVPFKCVRPSVSPSQPDDTHPSLQFPHDTVTPRCEEQVTQVENAANLLRTSGRLRIVRLAEQNIQLKIILSLKWFHREVIIVLNSK